MAEPTDLDEAATREPRVTSGTLRARVDHLRRAIGELDAQIEERRRLSARFRKQVQEELDEVLRHLRQLPAPWSGGYLPDREFLRLNFHKSATSRKREMRQEELKLWEDLRKLLEKRRELVLELEQVRASGRTS